MNRSRFVSTFAFVVLLALGAVPMVQPAHAASLTVDNPDDYPDIAVGDGSCNAVRYQIIPGTPPITVPILVGCTLRAAIQEANALAGADTISLPSGTYTLTIAGQDEDAAATGDLDVTSDITLTGAGAATTIIQAGTTTSNGIDRLFHIRNKAIAMVSGVRIQHGAVNIYGGGIANENSATLTLTNSTISGNKANSAGAIFNNSKLAIISSTISGNTVNFVGGGIYNNGTLTVINSTISGNKANTNGGGIYSLNTATLLNTTVAENVADANADGTGDGGGLSAFGANSTINLRNTLIGNNTKGNATDKSNCFTVSPLTSQGYNLIESTDGCTITGDIATNITGKNPGIGPLQDNGGPTQTHALLPPMQGPVFGFVGSPAINAGDPAGCKAADGTLLSTDQRGVARPQGVRCDIGAFELEVAPPAPTTYRIYIPMALK